MGIDGGTPSGLLNYPSAFRRGDEMGRAFWAICLVLLVTLNTSVPFASQANTAGDGERLAQFEQSLDSLRRHYKIPGLSAAIVHNQRIIWDAGFGFQDIAGGILATPDTPYRIASLTKTFASTLLMQCVERGQLDLDAPINNYTSSITQPGVRIRHVFTHTSESVPPGERFIYNGNRFAALTAVIDSCASKPFREDLAKTILDPLEMWDSVPGQDMESPSPSAAALFTPETLQRYKSVIQRLAKPYTLDSRGQPVLSAYPNRGISASAGLISTVRDLARYDAAVDRHLLLGAETQEVAWTNAVNSWGQVLPYAKGWFVQNRAGTRLVWHYGYWPTFSSLILKVPSRDMTLILMANSDGLSAPFSNALGGVGDVTARRSLTFSCKCSTTLRRLKATRLTWISPSPGNTTATSSTASQIPRGLPSGLTRSRSAVRTRSAGRASGSTSRRPSSSRSSSSRRVTSSIEHTRRR